MASRKLRLWIALVVFLLSVALLLGALLPAPRQRQSVPMPPVTLPTPEVHLFDWEGGV